MNVLFTRKAKKAFVGRYARLLLIERVSRPAKIFCGLAELARRIFVRSYLKVKSYFLMENKVIWDEIDLFLRSLNIIECRVNVGSSRVFLCGGSNSLPTNNGPKFLREYILSKLSKEDNNKIVLAENIFNEQFDDAIFDNLLLLEKSIASFCSRIFLILESPGAIAELGSFCIIDETRAKLSVVVQQIHNEAKSYIKDGPLKSLPRSSILVYDWESYDEQKGTEVFTQSVDLVWDALSVDLQGLLENKVDNQLFKIDDYFHLCIFISTLTKITFPMTLTEIYKRLNGLLGGIKQSDLKLALRLGQYFKVIRKIEVNTTYFIGTVPENLFEFKALPNNHLNIEKIKLLASNFIHNIKDVKRKAAYEKSKVEVLNHD